MGYDVAPTTIDKDEQELASRGYPTNTSLGYKGVVMANFSAADAADEIMVDFGSSGLWYYNNGSWFQQSGVNPDGMIAVTVLVATDDELVVDFGSLGLWFWNYGWSQLSGVDSYGMFATDDDNDGLDEIHVDFGSLGVWRYDWDTLAWMQLSNLSPNNGLRMDTTLAGYEEGCWSFPMYGVWRIYGTGPTSYIQLTGTVTSNDDHVSAKITNSSGAEDLVMDFGSLGIWLCKEDYHSWYQFSSIDPSRVKEVKFVGGQDYELLVDDNAGGLYWVNWTGSGGNPTLITNTAIGPGSAWCETFDYDGTDSGDEEVIIPWTAGGASMFDFSAGSTLTLILTTSYYVKFMVKGDYYGRGYDSTIAFVFTSSSPMPGLWLYDKVNGYVQLSGLVPDGVY